MNPVVVEVTRGPLVESKHIVHAVVMDESAKTIASYGDPEQLIYPRSAIKILQALSLIESGAAAKFSLQDRHLAIACASHAGDFEHIEVIKDWLSKINLSENDLECGAHVPGDKQSSEQLIRQNQQPNRMHNNCSGKHCGILTTCLQMGWQTHVYCDWQHPIQVRLRKILGQLAHINFEQAPWGTDGCGIPTYAMPLQSIATAFAEMMKKESGQVLMRALANQPHMVAGKNQLCTEVTKITNGKSFAKVGAEGVYTAFSPVHGKVIALKVQDGAVRAAEAVICKLMFDNQMISDGDYSELKKRVLQPVKNWSGLVVGNIRA